MLINFNRLLVLCPLFIFHQFFLVVKWNILRLPCVICFVACLNFEKKLNAFLFSCFGIQCVKCDNFCVDSHFVGTIYQYDSWSAFCLQPLLDKQRTSRRSCFAGCLQIVLSDMHHHMLEAWGIVKFCAKAISFFLCWLF